MADITQRNQGFVDDSGKVNWRGDQIAAPQGGQSIYTNSSIQLAQLGSRKVVGDRVFRYSKAAAAVIAGRLQQSTAAVNAGSTLGATGTKGDTTVTYYAAAAVAANSYAEGSLLCVSGAAVTGGNVYRIKSHDAISSAGTQTLYLYDPLAAAVTASAEYALVANMYKAVQDSTTGAVEHIVGVAPVAATTNDYFWLQTWGPASIQSAGGAAKGNAVCVDDTGGVALAITASLQIGAPIIGQAQQAISAGEWGLVFIQIAP